MEGSLTLTLYGGLQSENFCENGFYSEEDDNYEGDDRNRDGDNGVDLKGFAG